MLTLGGPDMDDLERPSEFYYKSMKASGKTKYYYRCSRRCRSLLNMGPVHPNGEERNKENLTRTSHCDSHARFRLDLTSQNLKTLEVFLF